MDHGGAALGTIEGCCGDSEAARYVARSSVVVGVSFNAAAATRSHSSTPSTALREPARALPDTRGFGAGWLPGGQRARGTPPSTVSLFELSGSAHVEEKLPHVQVCVHVLCR
jgi:hypothetical protein